MLEDRVVGVVEYIDKLIKTLRRYIYVYSEIEQAYRKEFKRDMYSGKQSSLKDKIFQAREKLDKLGKELDSNKFNMVNGIISLKDAVENFISHIEGIIEYNPIKLLVKAFPEIKENENVWNIVATITEKHDSEHWEKYARFYKARLYKGFYTSYMDEQQNTIKFNQKQLAFVMAILNKIDGIIDIFIHIYCSPENEGKISHNQNWIKKQLCQSREEIKLIKDEMLHSNFLTADDTIIRIISLLHFFSDTFTPLQVYKNSEDIPAQLISMNNDLERIGQVMIKFQKKVKEQQELDELFGSGIAVSIAAQDDSSVTELPAGESKTELAMIVAPVHLDKTYDSGQKAIAVCNKPGLEDIPQEEALEILGEKYQSEEKGWNPLVWLTRPQVLKRLFGWPFILAFLVAIFWCIYYLYESVMPKTGSVILLGTKYKSSVDAFCFAGNESALCSGVILPFSVSRFWDVIFVFVLLSAYFLTQILVVINAIKKKAGDISAHYFFMRGGFWFIVTLSVLMIFIMHIYFGRGIIIGWSNNVCLYCLLLSLFYSLIQYQDNEWPSSFYLGVVFAGSLVVGIFDGAISGIFTIILASIAVAFGFLLGSMMMAIWNSIIHVFRKKKNKPQQVRALVVIDKKKDLIVKSIV